MRRSTLTLLSKKDGLISFGTFITTQLLIHSKFKCITSMLTKLDKSQKPIDFETNITMEMYFILLWVLNLKREIGEDMKAQGTIIVG